MRKSTYKLLVGIMAAALAAGSVPVMADSLPEDGTASEASESSEPSDESPDGTEIPGEGSEETLPGEDGEETDPEGEGESGPEEGQESEEPPAEEDGAESGEEDGSESEDGGEETPGEGTSEEETSEEETSEEEEEPEEEKDEKEKEEEERKHTSDDGTEKEGTMEDPVPTGGERRPEIPQRVLTYSVRNYEKVKVTLIRASSDTRIREFPDASSDGSIVAELRKGAIVRLIDDPGSGWYFVETRDRNGRVIRGYSQSEGFDKLSKKVAAKAKEDPTKVETVKTINAGFGAVEKTTYDELSLDESVAGMRKDLLNYALQYLGNPYLKGGSSLTEGTNCTGLARAVYAEFGISLPGKLADMYEVGTKIPVKKAQPGDLIYYINDKGVKEVMICLSAKEDGLIQVIEVSPKTGAIVVKDLDRNVMCRARTFEKLNAPSAHEGNEIIDLTGWTKVGPSRITSYCYKCNTPANSAVTASGIPATEWHTVAVDSSVIPLGSKVYIEGYGVFIAEDTGVKGKWCDLYVYNHECSLWDIAEVYYQ